MTGCKRQKNLQSNSLTVSVAAQNRDAMQAYVSCIY